LPLGLCWFELEMALLENLKQINLWIFTTLRNCHVSLKNLENVHSSWKKIITSWCYNWRFLFLDFDIYFLFKCWFKLVHIKDVPLLLLSFNPTIVCYYFNICRLLYDLDLVLFQQLVLILALVNTQIWQPVVTVHCEHLEFSKKP
jgi:hypothetical protein